MYQFSIKDFELSLNDKIATSNENVPTIYPQLRINEYMRQDIIADRSVDNYITSSEVIQLFTKYSYRCIYCHIGLHYRSWTLDCIDNNITHIYSNCVIACLKCNVNRKDMLFNQFYRLEALKRYDKKYPLIHIINDENKLVFEKLKSNICGGLSLVFHRYHEKDITFIQRCEYINDQWQLSNKGNIVEKVVGFDANALYLGCLCQDMTCGKHKYVTKDKYKFKYILRLCGGRHNRATSFI